MKYIINLGEWLDKKATFLKTKERLKSISSKIALYIMHRKVYV